MSGAVSWRDHHLDIGRGGRPSARAARGVRPTNAASKACKTIRRLHSSCARRQRCQPLRELAVQAGERQGVHGLGIMGAAIIAVWGMCAGICPPTGCGNPGSRHARGGDTPWCQAGETQCCVHTTRMAGNLGSAPCWRQMPAPPMPRPAMMAAPMMPRPWHTLALASLTRVAEVADTLSSWRNLE